MDLFEFRARFDAGETREAIANDAQRSQSSERADIGRAQRGQPVHARVLGRLRWRLGVAINGSKRKKSAY